MSDDVNVLLAEPYTPSAGRGEPSQRSAMKFLLMSSPCMWSSKPPAVSAYIIGVREMHDARGTRCCSHSYMREIKTRMRSGLDYAVRGK